MAESVIGSKEIAIAVITFVLANIASVTGTALPLTSEQIYASGLILMGLVRTFWTSGKIQSFLPKSG